MAQSLKNWIKDARKWARVNSEQNITLTDILMVKTGRDFSNCYKAVTSKPTSRMFFIESRLRWFKEKKGKTLEKRKEDIKGSLRLI